MVLKLKLSNGFKIYLILLVVSFILFIIFYSYFPAWLKQTNIDNALYLLSSFIQGEAAVLAIVVTLSIVAIQLTASSYSTRAIGLLKESASLWILVLTFIIAIFYSSWVLKFTVPVDNISTNEFQIWIAFLLMIYAFSSLIPYLLEILNFTDPKTIIQLLASKITKEKLISSTQVESNDVSYRPSGGPIQPLSDVMISAVMKYDYGALKDCLDSIENSMLKILENRELSYTEETDVANHLFLHHISRVGEVAIDKNDEESTVLIIKSLSRLGTMGVSLNYSTFSNQAATAIGELGKKAVLKNNKRILDHLQVYLGSLGQNFVAKGLEFEVNSVLHWNFVICRTGLVESLHKPNYPDDLTTIIENEVYFNFNYNLLSGSIGFINGIGEFALGRSNETKILNAVVENIIKIQKLNRKYNQDNEYFSTIEEEIEVSLQKYSINTPPLQS